MILTPKEVHGQHCPIRPWTFSLTNACKNPSLSDIRINFRQSGAVYAPTRAPRHRRRGLHLRIFQLSFPHRRGSACPGLSCMHRHSRPVGKSRENPLTTVHISWVHRHICSRHSGFLPPLFFASLARISFIRQRNSVENNLSVFRERLLIFYRNCSRS